MGKPPQTTAEEVFEKCFEGRPDYCEPRQAREIADVMDISDETAREKLRILVDHGELRSKRMGAVVYWRPCYTEDVGTDE